MILSQEQQKHKNYDPETLNTSQTFQHNYLLYLGLGFNYATILFYL